jgi:hypothetical protein
LFFFPFNLIQVQGYSPTAAGAALLPFILVMFLLSRWSGGSGRVEAGLGAGGGGTLATAPGFGGGDHYQNVTQLCFES